MQMPLIGLYLALINVSGTLYGQAAPSLNLSSPLPLEKAAVLGPEYTLIHPLIGTWQVLQRTWSKAGAKPTTSPRFRARRQLIGHFLQEVMEPNPGTPAPPFKRMAYLNFNNANRRWEYLVLDTRWPAMMFETSKDDAMTNGNQLWFYLDAFVMPPLMNKEKAGQLARQRRTITFLGSDRQQVRQYLTLPAGKEYLAFEYIYTRVKKAAPTRD